MSIIICPGIHDRELTDSFISGWLEVSGDSLSNQNMLKTLVFPGEGILALSAPHIVQFLSDRLPNPQDSPVVFISFSAGVVGAIVAARNWQILGGQVKAFIAIDGWGVPLSGNFPIHRLSHDYFTHWSSLLLGGGHNNFYAEPAVDHLSMWRSPQTVLGWWVDYPGEADPQISRLTAAEFLHRLLKRYDKK
jgi:hypothetical protein